MLSEVDCGEGCLHPLLAVQVPSLDYEVCTDNDIPHLHATVHRHGLLPALHLSRPEHAVEDGDDTHEVEDALLLAWLHAATSDNTTAFLRISTPSGVELEGLVDPEQAMDAVQEYAEDGEGMFDVELG